MLLTLLYACFETTAFEPKVIEANTQTQEVSTSNEENVIFMKQHSITVEVIPQVAWGESPSSENCRHHKIEKISIHHSATLTNKNASVPKHLQSYQRFHQKQGWFDIAYHFVIDLEGNVYQGRSIDCAGDTFTSYTPDGHLLIMLDGNFEQQKPTEQAWETLVKMVSWGLHEYNIDSTNISLHKDLAATACPGKHLAEQITSTLSNSLITESITLVMLNEDLGKERVQAITQ